MKQDNLKPKNCYIFQMNSCFLFDFTDNSDTMGSAWKSLPDGATGSGNRTLKDAQRGTGGYLKNIHTEICVAWRI